tara:strand:- start:887 stop:1324 length:438 start_codon:yes stop_codon:yes gene_type:complete
MRSITKLIVHCSATREGKDYSVDTIRRWHLKRGWRDIGYHFVIQLNGEINEGRPIEQTGAHTKGENYCSIGICYIGGVEAERNKEGGWTAKDTRTIEQKEALEELLCSLKLQYPKAIVYGHRDFSSKACPSFDAKSEYEWISKQI